MRIRKTPTTVSLWLSKLDTINWSHEPGQSWPCSTLSGKAIHVSYDRHGLTHLSVNSMLRPSQIEAIDAHELNSCVYDHLRLKLETDHPCHPVIISQFEDTHVTSIRFIQDSTD